MKLNPFSTLMNLKISKICLSLVASIVLLDCNGLVSANENVERFVSVDIGSLQVLYKPEEDQIVQSSLLNTFIIAELVLQAVQQGALSWDTKLNATPLNAQGKTSARKSIILSEELTLKELYNSLILLNSLHAEQLLTAKLKEISQHDVHRKNIAKNFFLKDDISIEDPECSLEQLGVLISSVINGTPNEVLSIEDQHVNIGDRVFPSQMKISSSKQSKILFFHDEDSNVYAAIALARNNLKPDHVRRVVIIGQSENKNEINKDLSLSLLRAVNDFETVRVVRKSNFAQSFPVINGKQKEVKVNVSDDVFVTFEKQYVMNASSKKVELVIQRKQPIKAPIAVGDILGTVNIVHDGKLFKTSPLFSEEQVDIEYSFPAAFYNMLLGFKRAKNDRQK